MKRNTNIEILRLVLMVFIFYWHIIVHGYGYVDYWTEGIALPFKLPGGKAEFLSVLFSPATYCFMFISGFYGMNYSYKRHITIEIWLIIIACSLFLFHLFFNRNELEHITISIVSTIFPILGGRWWFMTEYMLIFFISPIINQGIDNIDKRTFGIIIILFLGYNFLTFFRLSPNAGSNFVGLFTVYLIGRYCNIYNFIPSIKLSCGIYVTSIFLLFSLIMTTDMLFPEHNKYVFPLLGYNTPCVMAMAISMFFIAYNIKSFTNVRINKILRPVLFIYIITDGIGKILYRFIARLLLDDPLAGVGICILVIISCLAVGHAVVYIQNKIQTKITENVNVSL